MPYISATTDAFIHRCTVVNVDTVTTFLLLIGSQL